MFEPIQINSQSLPIEFRDLINNNRDILNYILAGELRKEGPYSFARLKIDFEGRGEAIRNLTNEELIDYSRVVNKVILNFSGFIFCDTLAAKGLQGVANKLYGVLKEIYKKSEGEDWASLKNLVKMLYDPPYDLPERYQTVDKILTYFGTAPFHILTLNRSVMYDNPDSNMPIVRAGSQIIDFKDFENFLSESLKSLAGRYVNRHGLSMLNSGNSAQSKGEHLNNGLFFIACGQLEDKEKALGKKIKELLESFKINAFFAETENDLESLNSHIFQNLNKCVGFIGILHKRKGNHETSVWINQEVAIAAFINSSQRKLPSLILYENGIAEEGLIKYTIANPPRFVSDEEVLGYIKSWIASRDLGFKTSEV
jgi:hypothetical protein